METLPEGTRLTDLSILSELHHSEKVLENAREGGLAFNSF